MYKLTSTSTILRTTDGASIPADPANVDYAEYLAWLAQGNTPLPVNPVVPGIPQTVTMRQARRALLGAGLLPQVNAAIAAMPGPAGDAARIDWEFSSDVQRDWPLVSALAPVLGLTSAQLDQLFITAATL